MEEQTKQTHLIKKRAQAQVDSLLSSTRFQGRINTSAAQTSSQNSKPYQTFAQIPNPDRETKKKFFRRTLRNQIQKQQQKRSFAMIKSVLF